MSTTKTTLTILGVIAALAGAYFITQTNTQEKVASFEGFNITGVSLTQGQTHFKPAELTQGQMSTMTFELRSWWIDVNSTEGWRKEWVSAFPGFAILTDKGKLNFHGEWVVLTLQGDDDQYSKLLTAEQKQKIEKIQNRIPRWVKE